LCRLYRCAVLSRGGFDMDPALLAELAHVRAQPRVSHVFPCSVS
jgi:putative component of membrane protein insertase Oxa1/YidC/SpoIIIJ protein YidD